MNRKKKKVIALFLGVLTVAILIMLAMLMSNEKMIKNSDWNVNKYNATISNNDETTKFLVNKKWNGTETPEKYTSTLTLYQKVIPDLEISYIEDLVDLANSVNNGESYEGKVVMLTRNLDFNDDSSYRNPNDTSYGDYNGDGTNEGIKAELLNSDTTVNYKGFRQNGFRAIGNSETNAFSGIFEGQGYKINNLFVNYINYSETEDRYFGLFGYVKNGIIDNLKLDTNISIDAMCGQKDAYIGGIVAYADNANITNCSTSGKIEAGTKNGDGNILYASVKLSAMVGWLKDGKIENCNTTTNIKVTDLYSNLQQYVAGIVSYVENGKIDKCINNGEIQYGARNGTINVGGLIAYLDNGLVSNCINSGKIRKLEELTTDDYARGMHTYIGGIIAYSNIGNVVNCNNIEDVEIVCYSNASDDNPNNAIGGIIGYSNNSKIINTSNKGNIICYSVSQSKVAGGIVGQIVNNSIVNGCYNEGNIQLAGYNCENAGGIAGLSNNSNINDCYNEGMIYANLTSYIWGGSEDRNVTEIGGIAGRIINNSKISNCYNKGELFDIVRIGGIVATAKNSEVYNCYNKADITMGKYETSGDGGFLSGIVLTARDSKIIKCYNEGNITSFENKRSSNTSLTGIVGRGYDIQILNCYNKGTIKGNGQTYNYVCGIAQYLSAGTIIKNCYNEGDIISYGGGGSDYAGPSGIVSIAYCTIENCYNKGNIYAEYYAAGISTLANNIVNCYNAGDIINNSTCNVSGIANKAKNIYNCTNIGKIVSEKSGYYIKLNGIAENVTEIRNCSNIGNIISAGEVHASGISSGGPVYNSYNAGKIYTNKYASGIGSFFRKVEFENSYYLNTSTDYNAEDGSSDEHKQQNIDEYTRGSKTLEEMQSQSFTDLLNENSETGDDLVDPAEWIYTGEEGTFPVIKQLTEINVQNVTVEINKEQIETEVQTILDEYKTDSVPTLINKDNNVYVIVDNVPSQTVTGNGEVTFTNLPEYKGSDIIEYQVFETKVEYKESQTSEAVELAQDEDYSVRYENNTVTNTIATSIEKNKVWDVDDDVNQYSATFELYKIENSNEVKVDEYANGRAVEPKTVKGNEKIVFENLAKYDENGNEIRYVIKETEIKKNDEIIDIDTFVKIDDENTIINSPKTIDISGTKSWDLINYDLSNLSVKVELYRNGEATGVYEITSAQNNWNYTFTNLEKYDSNNQKYNYSVRETQILNGEEDITNKFTAVYDGYDIRNDENIDFTVNKTWNVDNIDKYRATFRLHKIVDGKEIEVKDSTGNVIEKTVIGNSQAVFTNLPVRENDSVIIYSAVETLIEKTEDNGVTWNEVSESEFMKKRTNLSIVDVLYPIDENPAENVVTVVEEDIANTTTINISKNKEWRGVASPENYRATVALYKVVNSETETNVVEINGERLTPISVQPKTVVGNETVTFLNLAKYDGTTEIEYRMIETKAERFEEELNTWVPLLKVNSDGTMPEDSDTSDTEVLLKYGENNFSEDLTTWNDIRGRNYNATLDSGTAQIDEEGTLILDGNTTWSINNWDKGSFGTYEVQVKIDNDFEPVQTDNWYQASCIFGCELPSTQKDFGIVIDKNGYFALGYSTSTIYSSNINALDGQYHIITVVYEQNAIKFVIDGEIITTISYTSSGTEMTKLGIGWNADSTDTKIKGKVKKVKIYNQSIFEEKIKLNYYEETQEDKLYSNSSDEQTIYNTILKEYRIEKQWNVDNTEQYRATFTLCKEINGEKIVVKDENGENITKTIQGNGIETFKNVQKYENGLEIEYNVEETKIEKTEDNGSTWIELPKDTFSMAKENGIITNTFITEIDISGTKTWLDYENANNTRPESIKVNLLANGQKVQETEVRADSEGDWKYEFTRLPKYDESNDLIKYTVTEDKVENYETSINGFDITNTVITEEKFQKQWNGTETQEKYTSTLTLYKKAIPDLEISYIEDLVDLANSVNNGESYEGKVVMLTRNLDFNDDSSYRNPNDTSYGDYNEDGTIEGIKAELLNSDTTVNNNGFRYNGFRAIGNSEANAFSGIFEGQGYKINNLFVNYINYSETEDRYFGLFGYVKNGIIDNLKLDTNISIDAMIANSEEKNAYIGGIVAYADNTNIANCSTSGQVEAGTKYADNSSNVLNKVSVKLAAMVGYLKDGEINNCYTSTNIIARNLYGDAQVKYVGGIVGYVENGKIDKCNNDGEIQYGDTGTSTINVGGVIAYLDNGIANNCINQGEIKLCENAYYVYRAYIGGIIGHSNEGDILNCVNISNLEIQNMMNNSSGELLRAVGGIIGYSDNNTRIINANNKGDILSNGQYNAVGGISGEILNNTIISGCYNEGDIEEKGWAYDKIGGITGLSSNSIIKDSYNIGEINFTGTSSSGASSGVANEIGGIAGKIINNTTIKNSYNKGEILNFDVAGGIAGRLEGSNIESCYNSANIKNDGKSVVYNAGIACIISNGKVDKCYNTGNITVYGNTNLRVGGISAYSPSNSSSQILNQITNSYNKGNIETHSASVNYVGGITGDFNTIDSIVENCYNEGNITSYGSGLDSVDGVAGIVSGGSKVVIKNCYNKGNLFAEKSVVAGIATRVKNIVNCYNSGNIISNYDYNISGIAYKAEYIYNCTNMGNIVLSFKNTSSTFSVNGISAYSTEIRNCSNIGNIISSKSIYANGLSANGMIYNSYNAGKIIINNYASGIGGWGSTSAKFENSYYLNTSAKYYTYAGEDNIANVPDQYKQQYIEQYTKGSKTLEEMQSQSFADLLNENSETGNDLVEPAEWIYTGEEGTFPVIKQLTEINVPDVTVEIDKEQIEAEEQAILNENRTEELPTLINKDNDVYVIVDNVPSQTVTGNGEVTFTNLPGYKGSDIIEYQVFETKAEYKESQTSETVELSQDEDYYVIYENNTVINTLVTSIEKNKVWDVDDDVNQYSATFELYKLENKNEVKVDAYLNGKVVEPKTIVGNEKVIFDNLAKYDGNGNEIRYVIKETEIKKNDETIDIDTFLQIDDGNTIINSPKTIDISGTKSWDLINYDLSNLSVKVELYRNGEATGVYEIISAQNNWNYTFTNLEKYDANNQKYNYSIRETQILNGEEDVTNNFTAVYDVYDIRNDENINFTVNKTWNVDNADKYRATFRLHKTIQGKEIEVKDSRGNVIEETVIGNGEAVFTNLPVRENDTIIVYTAVEHKVEITEDNGENWTDITNDCTSERQEFSIVDNLYSTPEVQIDTVVTSNGEIKENKVEKITILEDKKLEKNWRGVSNVADYEATFKLYEVKKGDVEINYIEDLVDISNAANTVNTYEGKTILLKRTLDFNDDSSYKDPNDTSYGDYNGDGTTEGIKAELTNEGGCGFKPIARTQNGPRFKGTFDGNGYEIKNMYVNAGNYFGGLFGTIDNAKIINLGMVESRVTSNIPAAGIVGYTAYNSIISNCYNTGSVNGSNPVSGIAYTIQNSTISNCYNTAHITSSAPNAGIVFYNNGGTITNCYNAGKGESVNGSIGIAYSNSGTISNTYYLNTSATKGIYNTSDVEGVTKGLTEEEMKLITFVEQLNKNESEIDTEGVLRSWEYIEGSYPKLKALTENELNLTPAEGYEKQTVSKDGIVTFTDLPAYKGTRKIEYKILEVSARIKKTEESEWKILVEGEDYISEVTDDTIINELVTQYEVEKKWEDSENVNGNRAEYIEVQLQQTNSEGTTLNYGEVVVLNEENSWKHIWTQLPTMANGLNVTYSVKEISNVAGYTTTYNTETERKTIITNTEETTIRKVKKVWEDSNDQDKKRPASIEVQLKADGEDCGEAITLNAENNWEYTWNGLAKKNAGVDVEYTIEETVAIEGYSVEYRTEEIEGVKTFVVTNKYTPETTIRKVKKVWEDSNDQDKIRPASIEVQLKADGEDCGEAITLNAENNWEYTWNGLAKKNAGVDVEYTIEETVAIEGYSVEYRTEEIEGVKTFVVTNKYTPETTIRKVKKVWEDSNDQDKKRPASIEVQLKEDGKDCGEAITLNAENNWEYTWNGLAKKNAGVDIEYTIEETVAIDGYSVEYTTKEIEGVKTFVVTNTYTPEITARSVKKEWKDNDNQDGIRPESIKVQLNAGGEKYEVEGVENPVTLKVANDWTYTWSNLPKKENGVDIDYEVVEIGEVTGYTKESVVEGNKTIITNTHTPEKEFDLSLRKFITQVGKTEVKDRVPVVDVSPLKDGDNKNTTTAIYKHTKEPLKAKVGDTVIYTIRVYNEGDLAGYAKEIKDHIPEELEFVEYTEGDGSINDQYDWELVDERTIKTTYLEDKIINSFDGGEELDYEDIKIECRIKSTAPSNKNLTNIAEITKYRDKNGGDIEDRDNDKYVELLENSKLPDYKNEEIDRGDSYIPGQEDDDDFDKVYIEKIETPEDPENPSDPEEPENPSEPEEPENPSEPEEPENPNNPAEPEVPDKPETPNEEKEFNLSLLKWVKKVIVIEDGKQIIKETGYTGYENPEPTVKVDLKYDKLSKVVVKFEYEIKVTNKGETAGYATEVKDYIPEGLKFETVENSDWKEVNGEIVTNKLANTLINPGESASTNVILTWINKEDNVGLKVNTARITKTSIQETTIEDNSDTAPVQIKVNKTIEDVIDNIQNGNIEDALKMPKTGQTRIIYMSLLIVIIICIIIIIWKRNKDKENKENSKKEDSNNYKSK